MIKRNLLVIGVALTLSACGFHLRGTGTNEMAIKELDVSARDAYGQTVKDLRESLTNSGVQLSAGAPYKLVLTNEAQSQRAASFTSASRSAEYELTSTLSYQILSRSNLSLIDDKLEVQKVYVHDGNNLTGSDQEESQVRSEMRRDLIQRMLVRLQGLSPVQLAKLQETAEARAQAEADALEAARRADAQRPQQSPIQFPVK